MKASEIKKQEILSVATELFSTLPYHKVAMDDIARKAGVAKGTLYYHFKSKEALYASLLHKGLDSMLSRLKESFIKKDPLENLLLFIKELATFFHEKREFFLVLHQEESSLYSIRLKNCYEKVCTIRELLASLLREGIQKGCIRDDINSDLLIEIIMGMIKEPILKNNAVPESHIDTVAKVLTTGIKKSSCRD
ncbi:MAG: TetR/AcrR family transcriptional regulator [Nitrospirae bacterium]|nr:TetR/AcrR family transcriptional regulator [Nitrospirota bacterium]